MAPREGVEAASFFPTFIERSRNEGGKKDTAETPTPIFYRGHAQIKIAKIRFGYA